MGERQNLGESAWDRVATGSLSQSNVHYVCGWRLFEAGKTASQQCGNFANLAVFGGEFRQGYLSESTRPEIFLKIYPSVNWGSFSASEYWKCCGWELLFVAICSYLAVWSFVAEVLRGREIIALMLYIGNCKMHVSSSVLNERTNAMGSLEDFDIATLLQKVIAFFDGFSSDETEPTG